MLAQGRRLLQRSGTNGDFDDARALLSWEEMMSHAPTRSLIRNMVETWYQERHTRHAFRAARARSVSCLDFCRSVLTLVEGVLYPQRRRQRGS